MQDRTIANTSKAPRRVRKPFGRSQDALEGNSPIVPSEAKTRSEGMARRGQNTAFESAQKTPESPYRHFDPKNDPSEGHGHEPKNGVLESSEIAPDDLEKLREDVTAKLIRARWMKLVDKVPTMSLEDLKLFSGLPSRKVKTDEECISIGRIMLTYQAKVDAEENAPIKNDVSEKPKTVLQKLLERGRDDTMKFDDQKHRFKNFTSDDLPEPPPRKSKKTVEIKKITPAKTQMKNMERSKNPPMERIKQAMMEAALKRENRPILRDEKRVNKVIDYWNSKSGLKKVVCNSDGKGNTFLHTKNMIMWALLGTLGVPHRQCPKPKKYQYADFVYAIDCLEQDTITKVDDRGLSVFCKKLALHEFIFNVFYKPGMDMNDMWTLRSLSPFLYYISQR